MQGLSTITPSHRHPPRSQEESHERKNTAGAAQIRDMVLKELTNMVPKMTRKIKPSANTTESSKYLSCSRFKGKSSEILKVKVQLPSLAENADF